MPKEGGALQISYLIGGLRISLGSDTHTPGPRTHINGIVGAWRESGHGVCVNVASSYPMLSRFTKMPESSYARASRFKLLLADVTRLGIAVWSGINTFWRTSREPAPEVIYERSSAFQSLTSFHRYKRRAVRVVEVNGILSREAAHDRNGLVLERIAGALERHVLARADYIVVVSEPLKREVQRFAKVDPSRILVVPNAVEESLTHTSIARRFDGPVIVGFMGALAKWQQLPRIVESLAGDWGTLIEAANGRPVQLQIIGDGPDAGDINGAISASGLDDHITTLGRLPRNETIQASSAWCVGIAAHQRSTSDEMYHSPLKVYEYAALGMVILCTPSGDARALSSDGIPVVEYNNVDSFKDALLDAVRLAATQSGEDVSVCQDIVRRKHTWGDRAHRILQVVTDA